MQAALDVRQGAMDEQDAQEILSAFQSIQ